MINLKHNSGTNKFETFDQAIAWVKEFVEFVTVQFDGNEVVGKFGADGTINCKLLNGEVYKWKKHRKQ